MVVHHCRKKVVCCSYCMKVSCKVKIDIFHRYNLCVSAAGSSALYTENRSERWLTKCNNTFFTENRERVSDTNRSCCFSLSGRSGVDSGAENELCLMTRSFVFHKVVINFCLVLSVVLKLVLREAYFCSNVTYVQGLCLLCNFNVAFKCHYLFHLSICYKE